MKQDILMTEAVVLTAAPRAATTSDIVWVNVEHPTTPRLASKLINSCGICWKREENRNQAVLGNRNIKTSHEKQVSICKTPVSSEPC